MTQYILATIYFSSGRINESDDIAQKSMVWANKFDIGMRADLERLKAKIAKAKKNYKEEADYQEQWQISKDYMYKERIDLLKKNPFTQYEQLDKKYQVELLKKDNRNQQNKINTVITIGILLILLVIISIFLIRRLRILMKKRAIVFNKLAASERELKETMRQKDIAEKALRENELFAQEMLLQMEFNEAIIQQRRQISDDMHDELSTSLEALKFYVEDIKNRSAGTVAEKTLSDIRDEVSTVYQNARSYMHGLKTNNWETRFSLTGFLKEIQQKFSEKGLIDIKLDLDAERIKSGLTTHKHDQLYHIIREAISNVIKHAGATELTIDIRFKKDECNFIIADNGKGFKKELVVNGIGIQSMKNRIKDIGGELNINSLVTGTIIEGRVTL